MRAWRCGRGVSGAPGEGGTSTHGGPKKSHVAHSSAPWGSMGHVLTVACVRASETGHGNLTLPCRPTDRPAPRAIPATHAPCMQQRASSAAAPASSPARPASQALQRRPCRCRALRPLPERCVLPAQSAAVRTRPHCCCCSCRRTPWWSVTAGRYGGHTNSSLAAAAAGRDRCCARWAVGLIWSGRGTQGKAAAVGCAGQMAPERRRQCQSASVACRTLRLSAFFHGACPLCVLLLLDARAFTQANYTGGGGTLCGCRCGLGLG